ncbi:MAG: histidine phosphotransferase family protein [Gemmatimonas sp.]
MPQSIDARLLELICARLCHDLVGPVSAIGNGVELVTEFGEDMRGEALALIAQSASEAARRLQFFRVAFGSAAGGDGQSLPLREVRTRALALPLGGRVTVDWPESSGLDPALSRPATKVLLSLFLTAVDGAAGTGTVHLHIAPAGTAFDVSAAGAKAALDADVVRALAGELPAAEASPRTAVAVHAHIFAREAGLALAVRNDPGRITISARPAMA